MHESVLIRSTMVNSICIKLPRTSQQKRTSIHRHDIKISKIMIGPDRKMHSCCLSYLNLTVVVEPLNVIRMGMLPRGQAKFLDHRNIHQIVAATPSMMVWTRQSLTTRNMLKRLWRCSLSSCPPWHSKLAAQSKSYSSRSQRYQEPHQHRHRSLQC